IYLSKKSNLKKFCGDQMIPVRDCIKNQLDICNRKERECSFGISIMDKKEFKASMTFDMFMEAYDKHPDYKPCRNCVQDYEGSIWYKKINIPSPLTVNAAKVGIRKFFKKYKNKLIQIL
ncbi:MAG: hypothetical protein IID03_05475, partial [Candidatus Dadabacteria bacterium]|nr:hypothetical protein [Candidatus Dadabacteria bacterium]